MPWGKSIVFISGASKGIGREIFSAMLQRVPEKSEFIVLARNEQQLNELKVTTKNVKVKVLVADVGDLKSETLENLSNHLDVLAADVEPFENLFVFHNAGTVGDTTKPCVQITDPQSWSNYMTVNLLSMIQLNNLILGKITNKTITKERYIINITSLLAVKAFPSMGQYGVGKAAREAYCRALAVEEADLRVISYSPGPVLTDMHVDVHNSSYDETIREAFRPAAANSDVNKKTLSPPMTVKKLMNLLEDNKFTTGDRVDYFDDE